MKIGLFSVGLEAYWPQFPDLLPRLQGYQRRVHEGLAGEGVEVVDAGLVDSPQMARAAAETFRREGAEVLFLYVSTYALSSTVLPVVQKVGVPGVVLNLQPTAAIDYKVFNTLGDRGKMTGEWLAHCQACSAPEIACDFQRAGIPFHLVTGRSTTRMPGPRSTLGCRRPRGRRYAPEPRGRPRPLLRWDARCLQRHDPAVRRVRLPLRDRGDV